jgi:hypothetical protein
VEPDEVFVILVAAGDSAADDHGRYAERFCDRGKHAVKVVRRVYVVLAHRDYVLRFVE